MVRETNPAIVRRVVSAKTTEVLTRMLVGVTEEGGTGVLAASESFDVAGKTARRRSPI